MQSSYCRGQLNAVIFQVSEALDVFSIVQACEQTHMLAEDLQSNQIKSAVDQCLRITDFMEQSIDAFAGAVSNLVKENAIRNVELNCMMDGRRKLESELKMRKNMRLMTSCQNMALDDQERSDYGINSNGINPGEEVLPDSKAKSKPHNENSLHQLVEAQPAVLCEPEKMKNYALTTCDEHIRAGMSKTKVFDSDETGIMAPLLSEHPHQEMQAKQGKPDAVTASIAPRSLSIEFETSAVSGIHCCQCVSQLKSNTANIGHGPVREHVYETPNICSYSDRIAQQFQLSSRDLIGFLSELMGLLDDMGAVVSIQQQALEQLPDGCSYVHLGIRKIESQTLDLELALRATRKAVQDFMGSSLLFTISQERKERKTLLQKIEALNIEISSKDARIAAMHMENRSLLEKIDKKMKYEQQDRSKIDDQLLALTLEREQMKLEYSSRLDMMHEAVIKLTEEGELMDASFSEEVRRRDVLIEEMKSYLLGEIQIMKTTMEQLMAQNVISEETLHSVDVPNRNSSARILDTSIQLCNEVTPSKPSSAQAHFKKRSPLSSSSLSNAARVEHTGGNVPFFADLLNELRGVLGEAGNYNSEQGLESDASCQSSTAARVQRAKSRTQNPSST